MALPYASASAGVRARDEITKILRRLGCESIGFMDDFQKHEVLLAFKHRGQSVQLLASAKGWAQAYLKENPWNYSRRSTRQEYEVQAQAGPRGGQLGPARLDERTGHCNRMRHPVV
jgi:hypothetical protein